MPSYAPHVVEAHTEELDAKNRLIAAQALALREYEMSLTETELRLSTTIGLLERWARLLEDPTAPSPTRAEAVQLIHHIGQRARRKLNSASAAVSDVESGSA
jgi:hypothetical protein